VILILEVTSPQAPKLGRASRQTFHPEGGGIGRDNDNTWVLPHSKVSGHHAVISCRQAVYYIEDTSRNGVFLNSSKNRLTRGQPHALKSGDRILIDPYEIRVSIARDQDDTVGPHAAALPDDRTSDLRFDTPNPFEIEDPFGYDANDLPIELHHNHPRVEFELAQEIGESRRTLDDPWVAVHG